MHSYRSYKRIMPSGYLYEAIATTPRRTTEIKSLYNILTQESLSSHLNNSLYFTEEEQNVHDAEIIARRNSNGFMSLLPVVSRMVGLTVNLCEKYLDRCEAVCIYRDSLGLDPVPPRVHANRFEDVTG